MIFSYNWIKEFTDSKLPVAELTDKLTMAGVEVEAASDLSGGIDGVITAEILEVGSHPNADKLSLCTVKSMDSTYTIVCGAKNMKAGDRVALALHGATLPGGIKLKKSKIRGVASEGMMCSEVELGLANTSDGIMILPKDTELGVDIKDALGLNDHALEVCITPNRADCLSIRGLAREISAVTGAKFIASAIGALEEDKEEAKDNIKITLEDKDLCMRYSARVVKGVKVGPSPGWLKARLELSGIRSINNVVDATNYVLLEYGQPLHAFDLKKIKSGELIVRRAKKNENAKTLDDVERKLNDDMLVIADKDKVQAIAGVMGGLDSEVDEKTTEILLESAYFTPATVRRTSRELGLSSDSSYRFERGVDIEGVPLALDRVAGLIKELAGGKILKGIIDEYPEQKKNAVVNFRVGRAEKILGIKVSAKEATEIFTRLGMSVKDSGDDSLDVTVPSYRVDVNIEADLIEEYARITGYDKIPTTLPRAGISHAEPTDEVKLKSIIRNYFIGSGFLEAINYSFTSNEEGLPGLSSKDGVKVLNPLSEEQSVLRTNLLASLIENLSYNVARQNEEVALFELRPVFIPKGEGERPKEELHVAAIMYGLRDGFSWNRPKEDFDFFDVKGLSEKLIMTLGGADSIDALTFKNLPEESLLRETLHPGKSATVFYKGKEIGYIGELHPEVCEKLDLKKPAMALEINPLTPYKKRKKLAFKDLTKFPESSRDLAFVIDSEVPYSDIISGVKQIDTKVIEMIELFDVYYGKNIPKGKRSLAIRVIIRDRQKTLLTEEIEALMTRVAELLKDKFGADIRV
ncbi:MAG: phenylalanine--tRNA ligase subunit beta [Deltaproteobacteria bacterium]|nr:phenylalanine--tRNA ligase subunit beta [Deltaproteobacteria bacterium]